MEKVLFICMGNICRSPTAQGVFRHYVNNAGLSGLVTIDSAGTHRYHLGAAPDARAIAAAAKRRYDLNGLKARRIRDEDFAGFDYLLAMDRTNLDYLTEKCPPGHRAKLGLLLDYAPAALYREVPDPYYGRAEGFELVLDLVEQGAEGLLEHLRNKNGW
ncbi:MAG: low molecular weight phosphotyrosine protein phosphatase [Betaproteobacteria bacterium]|nr:low molecular weight phosphotyrosine protein phosphatase [Betaproteobacteria bacterium]